MPFNPDLHPRGPDGKFITKGAAAKELTTRLSKLKGKQLGEAKRLIGVLTGGKGVKGISATKSVPAVSKGSIKEALSGELARRAAKSTDAAKAKQLRDAADNLKGKSEGGFTPEPTLPYNSPASSVAEASAARRQEMGNYLKRELKREPTAAEIQDGLERATAHAQDLVRNAKQFIAIQPEHLENVLDDGRFKTQFETKRSGGVYALGDRQAAEEYAMGAPLKLDSKLRPNYGYFIDDENGVQQGSNAYGPFKVRLKDAVKERSTVTFTDSLGAEFDKITADPVGKVTANSVPSLDSSSFWNAKTAQDLPIYVETQIHGGLLASEIHSVSVPESYVKANPKQFAAVATKLKAKGIPVIVTKRLNV